MKVGIRTGSVRQNGEIRASVPGVMNCTEVRFGVDFSGGLSCEAADAGINVSFMKNKFLPPSVPKRYGKG